MLAGAAELSQRVSVKAGCSYLLQIRFQPDFDYFHLLNEPLILPKWQIEWFSADDRVLCVTEDTIDYEHRIDREEPIPYLQTAIAIAPPKTSQADIRLIQPSSGSLVVAGLSFMPTTEAIQNGDFVMTNRDRLPLSWQVVSGAVAVNRLEIVSLSGSSVEDTVLSQTFSVVAAAPYTLFVQSTWNAASARAQVPSDRQQQARLELHWKQDGEPLNNPVVISLVGQRFSGIAWTGQSPPGTTQAEIRLIQPRQGGTLQVNQVTFNRINEHSVPLIFLAEAPGDLTVSNVRVTYDLPTPAKDSTFSPANINRFSLTRRRSLSTEVPHPNASLDNLKLRKLLSTPDITNETAGVPSQPLEKTDPNTATSIPKLTAINPQEFSEGERLPLPATLPETLRSNLIKIWCNLFGNSGT